MRQFHFSNSSRFLQEGRKEGDKDLLFSITYFSINRQKENITLRIVYYRLWGKHIASPVVGGSVHAGCWRKNNATIVEIKIDRKP